MKTQKKNKSISSLKKYRLKKASQQSIKGGNSEDGIIDRRSGTITVLDTDME